MNDTDKIKEANRLLKEALAEIRANPKAVTLEEYARVAKVGLEMYSYAFEIGILAESQVAKYCKSFLPPKRRKTNKGATV